MARPRKAPAAQPIITWHPSDGPTEEITPGDLCLIGGKEGTFRVASPAAPAARPEVPGAMPNQPGDWDHCAVCNHMRWRHHDGVCTEYLDCECNGNFAEHPPAASPAAPADDEAAERMAQAMYDRYHWQQAESALAAGRPPMLAAQWGEGKTRAFWLPIAIAALAALREGQQQ